MRPPGLKTNPEECIQQFHVTCYNVISLEKPVVVAAAMCMPGFLLLFLLFWFLSCGCSGEGEGENQQPLERGGETKVLSCSLVLRLQPPTAHLGFFC